MGGKPEPRVEFPPPTWAEHFAEGLQTAYIGRTLTAVKHPANWGVLQDQALRAVWREVYGEDVGEDMPKPHLWPAAEHPWATTILAIVALAPDSNFLPSGQGGPSSAAAPFVCEIMRALVARHGEDYFYPQPINTGIGPGTI